MRFFPIGFFIVVLTKIFGYDSNNVNEQSTFIITIPKSGTNLMKVIVDKLLDVDLLPPKVDYSDFQIKEFVDINYPVILHFDQYHLQKHYPQAKKILLLRDSRDIVISLVDYIDRFGLQIWPGVPDNWKVLDREEKIICIINNPEIEYCFGKMDEVINSSSNIYICKYENLVNDDSCNVKEIQNIAEFLQSSYSMDEINDIAKNSFGNINSWTFFKGKKGRWKEEFNEKIKMHFKNSLLNYRCLQWEYEYDDNW